MQVFLTVLRSCIRLVSHWVSSDRVTQTRIYKLLKMFVATLIKTSLDMYETWGQQQQSKPKMCVWGGLSEMYLPSKHHGSVLLLVIFFKLACFLYILAPSRCFYVAKEKCAIKKHHYKLSCQLVNPFQQFCLLNSYHSPALHIIYNTFQSITLKVRSKNDCL